MAKEKQETASTSRVGVLMPEAAARRVRYA